MGTAHSPRTIVSGSETWGGKLRSAVYSQLLVSLKTFVNSPPQSVEQRRRGPGPLPQSEYRWSVMHPGSESGDTFISGSSHFSPAARLPGRFQVLCVTCSQEAFVRHMGAALEICCFCCCCCCFFFKLTPPCAGHAPPSGWAISLCAPSGVGDCGFCWNSEQDWLWSQQDQI